MYERFHRDQLEVVQTYPHMVREELEDFDLVIRTYFAVDRDKPSADVDRDKPSADSPVCLLYLFIIRHKEVVSTLSDAQ